MTGLGAGMVCFSHSPCLFIPDSLPEVAFLGLLSKHWTVYSGGLFDNLLQGFSLPTIGNVSDFPFSSYSHREQLGCSPHMPVLFNKWSWLPFFPPLYSSPIPSFQHYLVTTFKFLLLISSPPELTSLNKLRSLWGKQHLNTVEHEEVPYWEEIPRQDKQKASSANEQS